jgi:Na+/H+ antiporter NhaD/arsenite permease-like protein
LAWVAAGGGLLLLILDWRDANELLARVDYNILVFFPGLFIAVAGMFNCLMTSSC